MINQSLVVFDIETVPDTDAVPNLTGFDDQDIEKRRKALTDYHLEITDGKNSFPRQPFHKVVAISVLRAEIERLGSGEAYYLTELKSGGDVNSTEKELVNGFIKYFEHYRPRLVSFNGRTFDLPVLKYRAMKYGLSWPVLFDKTNKWENYGQRYAVDYHCDLLDVLRDFGASSAIKLHEVASILGLPGKFGMDGSKVAETYDSGKEGITDIRNYCETDVLSTYLLFLRQKLLEGAMTVEIHDRAVADVIAMIDQEQKDRPHLARYLEAWHEASNGQFLLQG